VPGDPAATATETVWATPSGTAVRAYNDSKILAERDARELAAKTGLELSAVLPTLMQGPMLGAPNRRGSVEIIRENLPGESAKAPARTIPDVIFKLLARLNPQMAMLRPNLGRKTLVDSGKARTLLGWHPRPSTRPSPTPPPRSSPRTPSASSRRQLVHAPGGLEPRPDAERGAQHVTLERGLARLAGRAPHREVQKRRPGGLVLVDAHHAAGLVHLPECHCSCPGRVVLRTLSDAPLQPQVNRKAV
jgi:hypothetical protein